MSSTTTTKPFEITKRMVWEAYKRVCAKGGAAGIDGLTIEGFNKDAKRNLYKLWNRMASGTYFPPAVKRVEIPKADGGMRPLGIPTVADRIAQTVVKMAFEPDVEPYFHEDSYGYRPNKSAHQAVGKARQRCWRNNFVLDVDIKGFFDNINHDLLMKAVQKHCQNPWVRLYITRWLKAPVQHEDGRLEKREKGTPQGGVISPLLANLYLHYAFDQWIARNYPNIPFERYADDIVIHLKSEAQAKLLKGQMEERMRQCHLELHPGKTKIVYCKDVDRTAQYPNISFKFLGFEFRPRGARNRHGKLFCNFLPAASREALTAMKRTVRAWRLKWCCEKSIEDLSRMFNPIAQGWIQYYSKYYKSALFPLAEHINQHLGKWVAHKYKTFRRKPRRAMHALGKMARKKTNLFAQWSILGYLPADGTRRAV
jgi:RNA-directed DNA polymerase